MLRQLLILPAAFYCICSARVTPGFIYSMGVRSAPDRQVHDLSLARGGLRVASEESRAYEQLISTVRSYATGQFMYAAPDCPEVYFLTGLRNPTRTLFDFLDDGEQDVTRVLAVLAARRITT